jgi:hypothetical protein
MSQSKGKLNGCVTAVIVLGAVGFLIAVIVYGSLFYFGFVQRGGVYDGLRRQLSQQMLTDLVPHVELYKIEHGAYPETLQDVAAGAPNGSAVFIEDSTNPIKPQPFFYQRVGCDKYYLRSVGPDGKPFTADDLTPQVNADTAGKLGLLNTRDASLETVCKTDPKTDAKPPKP